MPTLLEKKVEEQIEEILGHESILVANAAVTLSALRNGTGGYTGEPLQVALRKAFQEIIAERDKEIIEVLEGMSKMRFHDNTDVDIQKMGYNKALDDAITHLQHHKSTTV